MKKVKIDETKLGDFQYWEELFKTPEGNFQKLKKETKANILINAYSKAPDHIRLNKKLVMEGLTNFCFYFFNIDERLKDKNFCLEYIEKNRHPSLFGIPKEYQEEFFEKIIVKNPWEIRDLFYDKNLFHLRNQENYIKWIKLNPKIYKELMMFKFIQQDFLLAEVAVQTNIELLFDMPKSIAKKIVAKNIDMFLEYVDKNINVFKFLPLKIRNDKEFVLKMIPKLNYESIQFVGTAALEYKEIILAMKNFYHATLDKLPSKFYTDKEIAYHITKHTLYVYDCFKDCSNFTITELIKDILSQTKSTYFYERLAENHKRNAEIINVLLDINYFKEEKEIKNHHKIYNYSLFNSFEYVNVSVVKLLPQDIQSELIKEWKETIEENRDPEEIELLTFAQMKYLRIVLSSGIEQKANVDKPKL